ncbi:MAG: acyl-ACP desaturase [Acidobacteriota bacterium]
MPFETAEEVLDWYERQERTLTPSFISSIPWEKVKETPLDPKFVPVLLYMRDVETLTEMYHEELRRTPTGRDPVIAKFMERWGVEEITHGEVLNRFLNEAGFQTPEDWQRQVRRNVPIGYTVSTYLLTSLTNLLGSTFTAAHMSFGAIHEMSTAQGYRRMEMLANHPVLSMILQGIIREEAAHTQFYFNVARIELKKSSTARKIARKVVDAFWKPVGQGSLAKERAEYTIATLFSEPGGIEQLDRTVTHRCSQMPGFEGLSKVTTRIRDICRKAAATRSAAGIAATAFLYF